MRSLSASFGAEPRCGPLPPIGPVALFADPASMPGHALARAIDGHGVDRRRPAVIAIEHVPRVHLALAGFLAGEIGVMHVLQPLGQDMDTTQAACSVQAINPIGCVQERRRQQEHD